MMEISINPRFAARTIGDSVYLSLREEILALRLKPGEELSIKDTADSLGISRSPVRDALMRLASESLADIFPQRGCRVSLISASRVEQELFLREGLEILALKRLFASSHQKGFSDMARAIEHQQSAIENGDFIKLLDYDERFHGVLFDAANQAYARQILRTNCVHYHRIRLLSSYLNAVASNVLNEHRAILGALEAGDEAQALKLEKEHLHRLDFQHNDLRKQYPDYFQD